MKPEQNARNQIDQLLGGTGWKIRNIEEYDPSESLGGAGWYCRLSSLSG